MNLEYFWIYIEMYFCKSDQKWAIIIDNNKKYDGTCLSGFARSMARDFFKHILCEYSPAFFVKT